MKARAIRCTHLPPTRGDYTVSVAQGGTATPGATKQLLPPDRVLTYYVFTRERWFRVYFLHAENFLAFDQIQLDAYRAVVWRRFEETFKLRPVIPIFERNEMTECLIKPRQPTSIGITWHIQPFFNAVGTQCLLAVFLPIVCFLPVFFPGDSQFYQEDTLLWIGPC